MGVLQEYKPPSPYLHFMHVFQKLFNGCRHFGGKNKPCQEKITIIHDPIIICKIPTLNHRTVFGSKTLLLVDIFGLSSFVWNPQF